MKSLYTPSRLLPILINLGCEVRVGYPAYSLGYPTQWVAARTTVRKKITERYSLVDLKPLVFQPLQVPHVI
jgi:hypothetical protein